jgi:hypothetical protein
LPHLHPPLHSGSPPPSLASPCFPPPLPSPPPWAQVPDFTSSIGSEGEAQAFLDASASDLPKQPPAASAEERETPIGKVMLFTSKSEAPGIYKALAMQFAGKARLLFAWATVDPSEGPSYPLMQKMNVSDVDVCAVSPECIVCCQKRGHATPCTASAQEGFLHCQCLCVLVSCLPNAAALRVVVPLSQYLRGRALSGYQHITLVPPSPWPCAPPPPNPAGAQGSRHDHPVPAAPQAPGC